jgi:predicted kinase
MKFLILNGSSTSGKSTIVTEVLKVKDDYVKLSYDSLKRLFSKYVPNRDYEKVTDMLLALARYVVSKRYNIVSDGGLYRERREKMLDMARAEGYEIIEVNLEASYDVLEKRFDERVKNAETAIVKPTNLSKERFKELHDTYHQEKNSNALVFRTDELSPEDVTKKVLELL